jgi:hypothetical protein
MNWKKRTSLEIEESVDKRDFTGGYDFLPWVWYMRKFMIFAFFLNVFIGYKAYEEYLAIEGSIILVASIFFGIAIPSLIGGLLIREHKEKKKGISR